MPRINRFNSGSNINTAPQEGYNLIDKTLDTVKESVNITKTHNERVEDIKIRKKLIEKREEEKIKNLEDRKKLEKVEKDYHEFNLSLGKDRNSPEGVKKTIDYLQNKRKEYGNSDLVALKAANYLLMQESNLMTASAKKQAIAEKKEYKLKFIEGLSKRALDISQDILNGNNPLSKIKHLEDYGNQIKNNPDLSPEEKAVYLSDILKTTNSLKAKYMKEKNTQLNESSSASFKNTLNNTGNLLERGSIDLEDAFKIIDDSSKSLRYTKDRIDLIAGIEKSKMMKNYIMNNIYDSTTRSEAKNFAEHVLSKNKDILTLEDKSVIDRAINSFTKTSKAKYMTNNKAWKELGNTRSLSPNNLMNSDSSIDLLVKRQEEKVKQVQELASSTGEKATLFSPAEKNMYKTFLQDGSPQELSYFFSDTLSRFKGIDNKKFYLNALYELNPDLFILAKTSEENINVGELAFVGWKRVQDDSFVRPTDGNMKDRFNEFTGLVPAKVSESFFNTVKFVYYGSLPVSGSKYAQKDEIQAAVESLTGPIVSFENVKLIPFKKDNGEYSSDSDIDKAIYGYASLLKKGEAKRIKGFGDTPQQQASSFLKIFREESRLVSIGDSKYNLISETGIPLVDIDGKILELNLKTLAKNSAYMTTVEKVADFLSDVLIESFHDKRE